jgi:ribosomal-protein-alanine N-acetyltransferase
MTNISLKKWKISDYKRMYELYANDNVLKTLSNSVGKASKIKPIDEKKFLEKILKENKKKQPSRIDFAIVVENEIIGSITASEINYKHKNAIIGYWIGEPFWGKGYATEALLELIKILFDKLDLKRIEGYCLSHNIGSQKVMLKSGFKFEGEKIKEIKINDKFYNRKYYGLTK